MGRHVLVVELLLFHGASVDILNKRQYTAVDCAQQVMRSACGLRSPVLPGAHRGSLVFKPDCEMATARVSGALC